MIWNHVLGEKSIHKDIDICFAFIVLQVMFKIPFPIHQIDDLFSDSINDEINICRANQKVLYKLCTMELIVFI